MRARLFPGFLLLLAPLLAAGGAAAQPAQPLDRLLPQIRRDHPGQFLDAEGANTGGNPHYHLKWLTPDGRVLWLDADARTGRVVGQSPGRDNFDRPRFRAPDGEEDGGAADRGGEGRRFAPRYERQDDAAPAGRRPFRASGDDGEERGGFARPRFGERNGQDRPGFGRNFERGNGGEGRFGRREFGGGGFGNRNFGGGGRDRRGGR